MSFIEIQSLWDDDSFGLTSADFRRWPADSRRPFERDPHRGALQAMLDAYLDYGKKRIGRSTGTPASEDAVVQLLCAEIAAAIDEMKTILHRNFKVLEGFAARAEMPPLKQRVEYKFHNAVVAERCSLLASRLFKAAGTAGIAPELPFGRILSDITVGRQHISNQFEQLGRSYGAFLFGIENSKDFMV